MGEVAAPLPAAAVVVGGKARLRFAAPEVAPSASTALTAPASTALVATELPAPPSIHGERFAVARRDPACAEALAAVVAAPTESHGSYRQPVLMIGGGAVFLYFFLGAGAPPAFVVFALAIMVAWFGLAIRSYKLVEQYQRAPVQPRLAIALTRTTEVHHHHSREGHHRTSTSEHALLELEDGRRVPVTGPDDVLKQLVEDDLGVAYLKDGRLIGFRRLA